MRGQAGPHPWLVEAGAEDFRRYCVPCHGVSGRGDGPVALQLRQSPADLSLIAARRGGDFPHAEIAERIDGRFIPESHGTREMPIWGARLGEGYAAGDFTQALVRGRIENLIAYLETIQRDGGAP